MVAIYWDTLTKNKKNNKSVDSDIMIIYLLLLLGMFVFCYFRALSDADNCIELATEWPKGYFRKGRALAGLKVSILRVCTKLTTDSDGLSSD